jgi:hypothetical protein
MLRHKPHYKPGLKSVLPIDSPYLTIYFSQITRQFRSVQSLVELAEGSSQAMKWQGKYIGFTPPVSLLCLSLQKWPDPNFQADDSTGQNLKIDLQLMGSSKASLICSMCVNVQKYAENCTFKFYIFKEKFWGNVKEA